MGTDWTLQDRVYNPLDDFQSSGFIPAPEGDTNPDAHSDQFSGNSIDGAYSPYAGVSYGVDYTGFGIGNYRDSYTGEGDRIYWGRLDGSDITQINDAAAAQGGPEAGAGSMWGGLSVNAGGVVIPLPSSMSSGLGPGYALRAVVDPSTGGTTTIIENLPSIPEGSSYEVGQSVFSRSRFVGPDVLSVVASDPSIGKPSFSESAGSEPLNLGGGLHDISPEQIIYDAGTEVSTSASGTTVTTDTGTTRSAISTDFTSNLPGGANMEMTNMGVRSAPSSVYSGDTWTRGNVVDGVSISTEAGASGGTMAAGGSAAVTQPGSMEMVNLGASRPGRIVMGDVGDIQVHGAVDPWDGILGDVPDVPESGILLSDLPHPEIVELGNFGVGEGPEVAAGAMGELSDFVGDMGNLSLGGEGLGFMGSKLFNFAKARITDLGVGLALMPLFNYINTATGNDWTSRMIQMSMASIGLAAAGDPFGLVAAPIMWMVQDFAKERQRNIDNDDPEKIYGKKWGYVREGDKWYPAIITQQSKDLGFQADSSLITMMYGTGLSWKQKKGSDKWVPEFDNYRLKDFHIDDKQLDGSGDGSYDHMKKEDQLRDFYFLSDEDATKMLNNMAGGDLVAQSYGQDKYFAELNDGQRKEITSTSKLGFDSFMPHQDVSWNDLWEYDESASDDTKQERQQLGSYMDGIQDARRAFDMINDYRWSPAGAMVSDKYGQAEFEGSTKLRRIFREGGSLDDGEVRHWRGTENSGRNKFDDVRTWGLSTAMHKMTFLHPWKDSYTDQSNFGAQEESQVFLDTFKTELAMLYKLQKAAAKSKGFDKTYRREPGTGWATETDPVAATNAMALENDGIYRLYTDSNWQMPELNTAEALHLELLDIEEAGSASGEHYRTTAQQAYLSQKAIVRYWKTYIDDRGGGNELLDLYKDAETDYSTIDKNGFLPPPFWQRGDGDGTMGTLDMHFGTEPDSGVFFPDIIGNTGAGLRKHYAQSQEWNDATLSLVADQMEYLDTHAFVTGENDPDYIAGNWGGRYQDYFLSTGAAIPQFTDAEGAHDLEWRLGAWRKPEIAALAEMPEFEESGEHIDIGGGDQWGAGALNMGSGYTEIEGAEGYSIDADGAFWDPDGKFVGFSYDDLWTDVDRRAKTGRRKAHGRTDADREEKQQHRDEKHQQSRDDKHADAQADAAAAQAQAEADAQADADAAQAQADADAAADKKEQLRIYMQNFQADADAKAQAAAAAAAQAQADADAQAQADADAAAAAAAQQAQDQGTTTHGADAEEPAHHNAQLYIGEGREAPPDYQTPQMPHLPLGLHGG